ncbi:hypothetical protein CR513_61215, partial [Mucuna pruriens]
MSSITKVPPSSNDIVSTEESGWTTYFDDFFNNHVDNHKSSMSISGLARSSHVSDAASLVDKKLNNGKQVQEFSLNKNSNRSSFKKRKDIITALVDEALEDTATSPLNSPKVLYANCQIDKANRRNRHFVFSQKEKGNTSRQRDEQKELSFNGRDRDCTEIKKRDLCLVPLSTVACYVC